MHGSEVRNGEHEGSGEFNLHNLDIRSRATLASHSVPGYHSKLLPANQTMYLIAGIWDEEQRDFYTQET